MTSKVCAKIVNTYKTDTDARQKMLCHCALLTGVILISLAAIILIGGDIGGIISTMLSPVPMYGQEVADMVRHW